MQRGFLHAVGRVIFWRYQRGSWQYDIACAVILAFIFLTPKSVFDGSYFEQAPETESRLESSVEGETAVAQDPEGSDVVKQRAQLDASNPQKPD